MGASFKVGDKEFSGMSYGRLDGIIEDVVSFLEDLDLTDEELNHVGILEYKPDGKIPSDTCGILYKLLMERENNGISFLEYTYDLYTEYPWPTFSFEINTKSTCKLVRKVYGVGWEVDFGGTGSMSPETLINLEHLNNNSIAAFDYFAEGKHIPDNTYSVFNLDFSLEPIPGTNQGFVFKFIQMLGYAALCNLPLEII